MPLMPTRRTDLIVSALDEELLIWDGRASKTWCLNATARRVFESCDGVARRARVAEQMGETGEELLSLTLAELSGKDLLAEEMPAGYPTRREFLARWGTRAVLLPLVAAVVAPRPAFAVSVDSGIGAPGDGGGDAPAPFDGTPVPGGDGGGDAPALFDGTPVPGGDGGGDAPAAPDLPTPDLTEPIDTGVHVTGDLGGDI